MAEPQQKLNKIRDEISELQDKRGDIEAAPLTREEASGRFEHLIARIRNDDITGLGPAGVSDGSINEDELARWLARPGSSCEIFGAEIHGALMARFDAETSGTEQGLASSDRRMRLKALDAELCKLEAAEESAIEKLLAEGVDVLRRPEADARHALGISIPQAAA